mgnify:CR=1 FL=1
MEDTKKLMEYGLQNYEYHNVLKKQKIITIPVKNGVPSMENFLGEAVIEGRVKTNAKAASVFK